MSPRVRFSLAGSFGLGWKDFLEAATIAEDLGFYGFYPSDHFMMPAGRDAPGRGYVGEQQHDSLTMIAALTGHTSRLRLGTLVLGNLFRSPSLVAKMINGIDHASGGRVELGIGANWQEEECLAYGFPFPPVGERLRRLRESLTVIRGLWTGNPESFEGDFYSYASPTFEPKPLQTPHPPIIVGGGSKQALRIAVDFADEWNSTAPYGTIKEKTALLDELCRQKGRTPESLRRSKLISLNLTQSKAEAEEVAARLTARMPVPEGVSAVTASQDVSLIGGPDDLVDQVERWASLGLDHLHFYTPRPMDRAALETFASQVMPKFS